MIAPALWLGERSERARGIAEEDHAEHALGVALGDVADGADDDARGIGGRGAIDGYEHAVVVEIVLDELAGRMTQGGAHRRQQAHDLGGVQDAAPPGRDDPARALVERQQRLRRRLAHLDDDALAHEREEAQHAVVHRAVVVAHPTADEDVLDAEAERARRQAPHAPR